MDAAKRTTSDEKNGSEPSGLLESLPTPTMENSVLGDRDALAGAGEKIGLKVDNLH